MIIESYYFGHIQVIEDVDAAGCSMTISMDAVSLINWTHEGHELAWDDPVKISILNFLVVLVFFRIECLEVVPAEADTFLKSFKAMKNCTFVEAITFTGVSERLEIWVIDFELLVSLLRVHFEDNDHEGTHQEASICDLGIVATATVVIDSRASLE